MKQNMVPPDIEQSSDEEVIEEESVEERADISKEVAFEKLKTQLESLNQVRETNNERFSRISEQIGEIRSMVIENEKNMRDVSIKATMASDSVKEVKPEILGTQVRKIDMKVETLKQKIEAKNVMDNMIMQELKELRAKINLFKGTDAVLSLNEEVKNELINISKIKNSVEIHADKVEQVFVHIQKNFVEFEKLKSQNENMLAVSSALQKQVNGLQTQLKTISTKDDLSRFRKTINDNLSSINKFSKNLRKNKQLITLLKKIEFRLQSMVFDNKKKIGELKEEDGTIKSSIAEIDCHLSTLSKKIKSATPKNHIKHVKKHFMLHKKKSGIILKTLEKIENKFFRWSKKCQKKKL
ncbi:MAG: hypothetical protein ABIC04_04005 [Nanoarchaeota archaeon]